MAWADLSSFTAWPDNRRAPEQMEAMRSPCDANRHFLAEVLMIAPDAKPRLPRGVRLTHNAAHGGWVLLAPERLFKADTIAAEILKRCTGELTFAAIVDDLAKTFTAPRERISADAANLLNGLIEKKLLEL
jgi:pyrroloquinoline quinone biosynthesis protein D